MARQDVGSFIPTTQVWDVSELYSTEVTSPKFKELLIRLYQQVGNIAMAINGKDTGIYDTSEFVCGQTFFPNPNPIAGQPNKERQVYRKVISFGTLPNTATKTVAHDIALSPGLFFTRIYGTAADPLTNKYIPLPFTSPGALGGAIELWVDGANVKIITGSDRTAFTITYVVLEYLKQ